MSRSQRIVHPDPIVARVLESVYERYHRAEFLPSDPLAFARRYDDPADREVVALIAASFAFGNVKAIAAALERILRPLGPHPARTLAEREPADWRNAFRGFVYRWVRAQDLRVYLAWIGATLRKHGSLARAWEVCDNPALPDILPTLQLWVEELTAQDVAPLRPRTRTLQRANGNRSVLPSGAHLLLTPPSGKSGCKRMQLFLRWVCRPDDGIDLGIWSVDPSRLIVPVDTHLLQAAHVLGLTDRTVADLRTAREITAALAHYSPADPVRFDFALVRPGILGLRGMVEDLRREAE